MIQKHLLEVGKFQGKKKNPQNFYFPILLLFSSLAIGDNMDPQ